MHHFFVTPQQISGDKIRIEGGDVNHMKNVLRMKLHEKAEISDGESRTYLCEVEAYEEDVAILHILEEMEADTEPASKLYLFQGLPKSDKMELIVQKAVELGVYQVIPVAMKRSVVRLDDKKAAKKADRWNSIAESAAKQAGRSRIPEVTMPLSYNEALKMAEELDVTLLPYELAGGMEVTREVIRQIKSGQSVGIFIGPEGGFEPEEVDAAVSMGAKVITLGRRILRTETAGLATLAVLMFELEQ
ncbi:16S rRNA (uracil(1498)-N(3))-methyltransferase [Coprococcus comes]|jgi:16S rRNA (uracil1498-N3)-methyltransferase|uniref:16S rRNA (uracil(1498)-N(3))-methyltransferase n=1 Tax=Coprococcus comes TaxID=410072 RepID=UPI00156DADD0|nr:16S rRNA (uracil(1498)-N(3))-methyltransferase [Coprococcus comes]MBU5248695.1 16S rRNA (uracil(1498)-N(3))-methyltransferase [Coprococcus comes]NSF16996.1 16S rRNA (uracil(1498)-N(3))-methyltransferase [Coprococcus comes]